MIDIVPGINEKDLTEIERKLDLVAPHVEWVQIDVADGILVPSTTFLDFSQWPSLTKKSLGTDLSRISLEAHLMVTNPEKYIQPLVDAGFKRLIAHIECHDPRRFLEEARFESVEVGVAIDAPTDFEELEPFLNEIDCVLVMMYEAGPSGQAFQPEQLEKVKTLRTNLPDVPIEVDGGITDQTAKLVVEAGATRLVATSFLFNDPGRIAHAFEQLNNACADTAL